jgi:hypothetical protein
MIPSSTCSAEEASQRLQSSSISRLMAAGVQEPRVTRNKQKYFFAGVSYYSWSGRGSLIERSVASTQSLRLPL